MTITRQAIIDEARKWVGTPWRHQGRVCAGLDCVGLVIVVAKALDIPHTDRRHYHRIAARGSLMNEVLAQTIERADRAPGSLAVFWMAEKTREAQHVGIVTECGGLIHADVKLKRCVEISRFPARLEKQIVGFYDLPGVED